MGALADLFKSERGFIGLALLVAATVLAAVGIMPVERWETFAMIIFGTYVAGKTVSSVALAMVGRAPAPVEPDWTKIAADLMLQLFPPAQAPAVASVVFEPAPAAPATEAP